SGDLLALSGDLLALSGDLLVSQSLLEGPTSGALPAPAVAVELLFDRAVRQSPHPAGPGAHGTGLTSGAAVEDLDLPVLGRDPLDEGAKALRLGLSGDPLGHRLRPQVPPEDGFPAAGTGTGRRGQ